jgi:hypothetical protein
MASIGALTVLLGRGHPRGPALLDEFGKASSGTPWTQVAYGMSCLGRPPSIGITDVC